MIPNNWYVILESKDVKRKPVSIKRLGEDLVLWRDGDAQVICAQNRCPHRGAALSLGRVVNGNIECPYHGFQYNNEGQCILVPCNPKDSPIPPRLKIKTFITKEAYGFIWLWWGEKTDKLPDIPWFDELLANYKFAATGSLRIPINYARLVESNFDVYHFHFVHRSLNFGLIGPLLDSYEVETDEHQGIISTLGKLCYDDSHSHSESFGYSFKLTMRFPNITFAQLLPRLNFITAATPIDEDNSWVFIRYHQDYLRDPLLGKLFAWLLLKFEVEVVQKKQDVPILYSLQPKYADARANNLIEADKAIIQYLNLRSKLLKKS
jgi:phenylpropionate dioxygenase-like ring-hydroxylating dioxygenase large terminal subunit